ncbi:IclR family transcriptional regulator [Mesorhizobium sp. CAU 1741]|uniref:IclR family transcriptional regulator n=1 Tax=Mesorhizobium sp. CAU 1741 TaxID=3140366 RepID=UPI00325ABEAD
MSQTLIKGLRVLEALAHSDTPRGLSELSRSLDMNQSAVQRLLSALVTAGYAEKVDTARKYQLTFSLWELGMRSIADNAARRRIHPTLRLGAHVTGLTCFFALAAPPFVIYLDRVEGARGRPHSAEPGRKVAITATASGKSIVPYLPARMRNALTQPATDWSGHVRFDGITQDALDALVKQVRRDRYAVSQSGVRKGMNSVAAPVWTNRPMPLGSIVLTASETELRAEDMPVYGARVLELAEEATVSLGGTSFRNAAELGPI